MRNLSMRRLRSGRRGFDFEIRGSEKQIFRAQKARARDVRFHCCDCGLVMVNGEEVGRPSFAQCRVGCRCRSSCRRKRGIFERRG
jgi:hypothetical protein